MFQIKKYEVIEQVFVQYIFMYIPYYTSFWWAEYLINKKNIMERIKALKELMKGSFFEL